jgi:hypothetical protein
MAKKESKKYVFLKDWKEFKKGEVVNGVEEPAEKFPEGVTPVRAPRPAGIAISAHRKRFFIPKTELGKTIKEANKAIPPVSTTGGATSGNTTTESKSLFTTKNIVMGVAILAIAYFGYTKFIKKGKK